MICDDDVEDVQDEEDRTDLDSPDMLCYPKWVYHTNG